MSSRGDAALHASTSPVASTLSLLLRLLAWPPLMPHPGLPAAAAAASLASAAPPLASRAGLGFTKSLLESAQGYFQQLNDGAQMRCAKSKDGSLRENSRMARHIYSQSACPLPTLVDKPGPAASAVDIRGAPRPWNHATGPPRLCTATMEVDEAALGAKDDGRGASAAGGCRYRNAALLAPGGSCSYKSNKQPDC